MSDISNTNTKIPKAMYLNMYSRYVLYKQKNKVEPTRIYTVKNGKDYVTLTRFKDMQSRFDSYWKQHDVQPSYVYVVKPATTSTKGPIQKACEKVIGPFTTITGFYNKMIGRGYKKEYNDTETLAQEVSDLSGLNCVNASQVTVLLAREMGYTARFCHVYCTQSGSGHIYSQIKGKELGSSWVKVDMAAAMSTTSKYPIGRVWCSDAPISSYNDPWLESDNGIT